LGLGRYKLDTAYSGLSDISQLEICRYISKRIQEQYASCYWTLDQNQIHEIASNILDISGKKHIMKKLNTSKGPAILATDGLRIPPPIVDTGNPPFFLIPFEHCLFELRSLLFCFVKNISCWPIWGFGSIDSGACARTLHLLYTVPTWN